MADTAPSPGLTKRAPKRRLWWSYKPPRRLRVTREGWIFILVAVGVGAAAVNTGNNLLFLVLGLMLSLIIISGVMSESTLRRIKVERHTPPRIHAQIPSLIEVTLHNLKKRLPSYSIELEDLLVGWSTDKRCYFLKVAPQGKQTAAYRTVIPRRGILKFTGYRVATRFPFALFEKWRELELPGEVVVYPELVPVPPVEETRRDHQGELGHHRPGRGDEVHGLRELRIGDDSRSIHWRTSARRGRLMVREYEEEEARHLCIYLDNARTKHKSDDGIDPVVERAISIAASLVVERSAAGQGLYLAVRGEMAPKVSPGSSPERLLRYLSLLEYAEAEDPPAFSRLPPGEAVMISPSPGASGFEGSVIALEESPHKGNLSPGRSKSA